jgi:hypothetical protein
MGVMQVGLVVDRGEPGGEETRTGAWVGRSSYEHAYHQLSLLIASNTPEK